MHDGKPCSYGRKSTKTVKPAKKTTRPAPKRRGK